jgi:hypothetical protein
MTAILAAGMALGALRYCAETNPAVVSFLVRMGLMEAGEREVLTTIIRNCDLRFDRPSAIDRPDGRVTAVDYDRKVLEFDFTRAQGARVGMKMSIYDSAWAGVPGYQHKGMIRLTEVGPQSSTAQIIMADDSVAPIQVGDIAHSPIWSPGYSMRFALIGPIDLDGDHNDDREKLNVMIREVSGAIDFDLPPPEFGKEVGTLTPLIDWYVTDERVLPQDFDPSFSKRIGEAIKGARLNGIRPMPIRRLLRYVNDAVAC